jgi:hypothetical protein
MSIGQYDIGCGVKFPEPLQTRPILHGRIDLIGHRVQPVRGNGAPSPSRPRAAPAFDSPFRYPNPSPNPSNAALEATWHPDAERP